jgi:hypothetical protein
VVNTLKEEGEVFDPYVSQGLSVGKNIDIELDFVKQTI